MVFVASRPLPRGFGLYDACISAESVTVLNSSSESDSMRAQFCEFCRHTLAYPREPQQISRVLLDIDPLRKRGLPDETELDIPGPDLDTALDLTDLDISSRSKIYQEANPMRNTR